MKKALIVGIMLSLMVGTASAVETSGRSIDGYLDSHHTHRVTVASVDDMEGIDLGVKLDAPELIKLSKNVSVGVEVEKDVVQTNMKEGWSAVAKVTVKWCLLDLSK